MTAAPVPIMAVLDDAIDAILSATGGTLAVPRGGYLGVQWLTKKECYRLTVDVVVKPAEDRIEPEAWGARRIVALEAKEAS